MKYLLFFSLVVLLSACSENPKEEQGCTIENIDLVGEWKAIDGAFEERPTAVSEQNRSDAGISSSDLRRNTNILIDSFELHFNNLKKVEWITERNTRTINYDLSREYSEINLRTGFTRATIEVVNCDQFRLIDDNRVLGYRSTFLMERK